jgi:hypothetical protein
MRSLQFFGLTSISSPPQGLPQVQLSHGMGNSVYRPTRLWPGVPQACSCIARLRDDDDCRGHLVVSVRVHSGAPSFTHCPHAPPEPLLHHPHSPLHLPMLRKGKQKGNIISLYYYLNLIRHTCIRPTSKPSIEFQHLSVETRLDSWCV